MELEREAITPALETEVLAAADTPRRLLEARSPSVEAEVEAAAIANPEVRAVQGVAEMVQQLKALLDHPEQLTQVEAVELPH